ncbi:MAG: DUF4388 domain-containing protein [Desulfuromonadales bacterium]|nr:DUF4388 domain-containing protein [Desulfuromonadales bacterium]
MPNLPPGAETEAMKTFKPDDQGRIVLPAGECRAFTGGAALVSATSSHLLLTPGDLSGGLCLAGRFGEVSIVDILSFLNMFRKTGVLRVLLPGGEKAIYLQQGEIVAASSTLLAENLGDCLCELGKVERETLLRMRKRHRSEQTLGKELVAAGLIESKDLWQAARYLVEKIVYDLFTHPGGGFSFVAAVLPGAELTKLSMSTQNMIMEGLRRTDEAELFRRRIPSFDMQAIVDLDRLDELAGGEATIARLAAEGKVTVRDILRRVGMGEFEALRILHQLIEKNCITLEDAPSVDIGGVCGEVVQLYNGVLALLTRRLLDLDVDVTREVHQFLRALPQPYAHVFGDLEPARDGMFDAARLLGHLSGLAEGDRRTLLVDALNELVFMYCLLARRELAVAEADELTRRVQDITARVKNLIGRNE